MYGLFLGDSCLEELKLIIHGGAGSSLKGKGGLAVVRESLRRRGPEVSGQAGGGAQVGHEDRVRGRHVPGDRRGRDATARCLRRGFEELTRPAQRLTTIKTKEIDDG